MVCASRTKFHTLALAVCLLLFLSKGPFSAFAKEGLFPLESIDSPFSGTEVAKAVWKVEFSLVEGRKKSATVFFVSKDGHFLTNWHVLKDLLWFLQDRGELNLVKGELKNGRPVTVRLKRPFRLFNEVTGESVLLPEVSIMGLPAQGEGLKKDEVTNVQGDFLVGKFNFNPVRWLRFSEQPLHDGDPVYGIGYPSSTARDSQKLRAADYQDGDSSLRGSVGKVTQAQAPGSFVSDLDGAPGMSGGPTLNGKGDVVGMLSRTEFLPGQSMQQYSGRAVHVSGNVIQSLLQKVCPECLAKAAPEPIQNGPDNDEKSVVLDDYYARLGLSKEASKAEIHKRWRFLMGRFLPDKALEDVQQRARYEEYQKRLNEAADTLEDDEKRQAYDDRKESSGAAPGPGFRRRGFTGGPVRSPLEKQMRVEFLKLRMRSFGGKFDPDFAMRQILMAFAGKYQTPETASAFAIAANGFISNGIQDLYKPYYEASIEVIERYMKMADPKIRRGILVTAVNGATKEKNIGDLLVRLAAAELSSENPVAAFSGLIDTVVEKKRLFSRPMYLALTIYALGRLPSGGLRSSKEWSDLVTLIYSVICEEPSAVAYWQLGKLDKYAPAALKDKIRSTREGWLKEHPEWEKEARQVQFSEWTRCLRILVPWI